MLALDRSSKAPIYLQLTNEIIKEISYGSIPPGYKFPGSRKLAALLELNRGTVTLAYEELESQGWVEIKPTSGCYVSEVLPKLHPERFTDDSNVTTGEKTSYGFADKYPYIDHFTPTTVEGEKITIDAGYPDVRLSPLKSISRNMYTILSGAHTRRLMNYTSRFKGDVNLREELCRHLRDTRSIQSDIDNIMITRGSLMAFSMIFQIILSAGERVIVGVPGFHVANNIIRIAGGEIVRVPIDKNGIDVDVIEHICLNTPIKAVFIMPHHHNPTTVSLSAERRMKLLELSRQYKFAIIEDDYDYDFHYSSSPILPMASSDRHGSVIYVGSLSKTIAPGLRMGYIVAPKNLIMHLSRLSRFIDCHGNSALERAVAMLFKEGEINRYLKKALKVYHHRRDIFCELLEKKIGNNIELEVPKGGMAAWVHFDPSINISDVRQKSAAKGLLMSRAIFHDHSGLPINAMRMGFASLNEQEMERAISILEEIL